MKRFLKASKAFMAEHAMVTLGLAAILFVSSILFTVHAVANHDAQNTSAPTAASGNIKSSDSTNDGDSIVATSIQPTANTPSSQQTVSKPSSSVSSNSTASAPSSYKAPVCTKTILHYTTSYKLATYLGAGQLSTYGGTDGYQETCTADSTGNVPYHVPLNPVNRVVTVGDGGGSLTVSSSPQSVPYDEVYNTRALPACDNLLQLTANDSTAKQWCIDNVVAGIMHYYGY